jgi:hypothetical protein
MSAPGVQPPAPSTRQLVRASLLAFAAALVVLVTAVLPAEYGIDPLGVGARVGLMPPRASAGAAPAPAAEKRLRFDRAQFELGPYDFVEYKYRLEQGDTMMFAWEATAAVAHDMHGVPDADHDKEVSFKKQDRRGDSATHVAPFSGMHGWFWENPGPDPITVDVTSSGFYSAAIEYRANGGRRNHTLLEAPPKP